MLSMNARDDVGYFCHVEFVRVHQYDKLMPFRVRFSSVGEHPELYTVVVNPNKLIFTHSQMIENEKRIPDIHAPIEKEDDWTWWADDFHKLRDKVAWVCQIQLKRMDGWEDGIAAVDEESFELLASWSLCYPVFRYRTALTPSILIGAAILQKRWYKKMEDEQLKQLRLNNA